MTKDERELVAAKAAQHDAKEKATKALSKHRLLLVALARAEASIVRATRRVAP